MRTCIKSVRTFVRTLFSSLQPHLFSCGEEIQHLFFDFFPHHAREGHGVRLKLRAIVLGALVKLRA